MPLKKTPTNEELIIKIEKLKYILISRATGGLSEDFEYVEIRDSLLQENRIDNKLPRFVKVCTSLNQFWGFIQPKFPTYAERRTYISTEFQPLLEILEANHRTPSIQSSGEVIGRVDAEHVRDAWEKALERRTNDPSGAITASRTLLESVCKYILDQKNVDYEDHADLPRLYFLASQELNLAPSQHSEHIFKQILGGCQSVVEGLGSLRNRLGDAHGKGSSSYKPSPRHAELAVNLAGTMATFLIATWDVQKAEERSDQEDPFGG